MLPDSLIELGFLRPMQEMSFSTFDLVMGQYWSWVNDTEMLSLDQSRYTRRGELLRLSSWGKPTAGLLRKRRLTSKKFSSS